MSNDASSREAGERKAVRQSSIDHRPTFMRGVAAGSVLVLVKFAVVMPIDIADFLYATCILVTLVITLGDLLHLSVFGSGSRFSDFILGLIFPLDAYAVLILYGLPLPD